MADAFALARAACGAPEGERAPKVRAAAQQMSGADRFCAQTAYTCLRRTLICAMRGHWLDAPLGAPLPLFCA